MEPETGQTPKTRRSKAYLRQRAFLAAYAISGRVTEAAKLAKIDRHLHKVWYKTDATYRQAFDDQQDETAQTLEDEAIRRAYEGVKRPVLYRGKSVKMGGSRKVLYETTYSDQLLIVLLKRFRPALYRDHVETQVTGTLEIVERIQQGRKRLIELKHDNDAAD